MSVIDIFAFVGGVSAKLYDDIEDNEELLNFKKNTFLMELLKGFHYISFMAVGMTDNLFYLISYLGNFLHTFNNEEAFSNPYEYSLSYSFFFGLFLLNYSKMYEAITSLSSYDSFIEMFGLSLFLGSMFSEPFLINVETSLIKLCYRLTCSLISLFLYFICKFPTNKYIYFYFFGYLGCSSIIQYICLNKKINKLEEKDDCKLIIKT
jgi:hypothetical protein